MPDCVNDIVIMKAYAMFLNETHATFTYKCIEMVIYAPQKREEAGQQGKRR